MLRPLQLRRRTLFAIALTLSIAVVAIGYTYRQRKYDDEEARYDFFMVLNAVLSKSSDYGFPGLVVVDKSGHEMYSWRYAILDRVDAVGEGSRLPPPSFYSWNSAVGREVTARGYGIDFRTGQSRYANVFAFSGADTPFCASTDYPFPQCPTALTPEKVPRDLIVLIQVRQSEIEWGQPGDIDLEKAIARCAGTTLATDSLFRGAVWIGFADGEYWQLSAKTPVCEILKLCSIRGAQQHRRDDLLLPYVLQRRGISLSDGRHN